MLTAEKVEAVAVNNSIYSNHSAWSLLCGGDQAACGGMIVLGTSLCRAWLSSDSSCFHWHNLLVPHSWRRVHGLLNFSYKRNSSPVIVSILMPRMVGILGSCPACGIRGYAQSLLAGIDIAKFKGDITMKSSR